jgi:DNA-binding HxlR family transcriptional regulator
VADALAWCAAAIGPVTELRELSGGCTSTMLALTTLTGDGVILRLITREPWLSHGYDLATREHDIRQMLRAVRYQLRALAVWMPLARLAAFQHT